MKSLKRNFVALTVLALGMVFAVNAFAGTVVVIQNNDGPGEGFNDPTAVAPIGGNPNVTLGAQRLYAFQYAAELWAQCLVSAVPIEVAAQMNTQFCTSTAAVLGSAGTTYIHRDWVAGNPPPKAATWYCQALANGIAGVDLNPGKPEINATFNSAIDNNNSCLKNVNWYYGIDATPGGDIDFVTVVAHEIGHGIGFQTFQSSTGTWYSGYVDAYGSLMYDEASVPPSYPSMTDAQRGASNIDDPNLVWDGAAANAMNTEVPMSAGVNSGRLRLHAPDPYASGSSLSHWSPALTPNQIMEPYYAGPNHATATGVDVQLLKDTGWTLDPNIPVATAITVFDVIPTDRGIDITAEFFSEADIVTVTVYRGEGRTEQPDVRVSAMDIDSDTPFRYLDESTVPGHEYTYAVGVRDESGERFSRPITVSAKTLDVSVEQNVPNPFNPVTSIRFTLPATAVVSLAVYDAKGKLVRTLLSEVRSYGTHSVDWDGVDNHGNVVSSGVYFYRLTAGKFTQSKKMVLLK